MKPLVVCIVDMNNGHVNQAIRCFRRIVDGFFERVHAKNPGLRCERIEVSPRDTNDPIPRHADLYLSSGGPGSPFDGDHEPWSQDYAAFLDGIVASRSASPEDHRSLFGVCYSYEMIVRHFQLGHLARRNGRKFGVMPVYTTREGQAHPLFAPFGDRLFAFEHRNWEVVDLDLARVEALGGQLLAQESRDGFSKGRAVLGLDVTAGIEAVQFHPEADRAGVLNWISRPEQASAFRATYGEDTYQAMLRTLDDPTRLARTYALVIPGWMVRRFNDLADHRGYERLLGPNADDVYQAFAA